ncbi:YdiU family protein [Massilia sp. W12]|uniref:protein adenylyltransferase SelO n=1 Tax=Massilia sp. W12 TaxID=3126507 RepID=UPI0030D3EE72
MTSAPLFSNDFATLPPAFYTRLQGTPLPAPQLLAHSAEMAQRLGLADCITHPEWVAGLAGNAVLPGSAPLAAVYSGHQFGVWAGQLGDGRALLLGDLEDSATPGQRLEVQLKGAGKTPYSRMGDGRAVLRSSIREFLCSEAMAGLGIPSTRALSLIGADYPVFRESTESAAVVARVAPSFIRFGSFEHWFYQGRTEELKQLADYVIARFYPALQSQPQPYLALLKEVIARTARLVAQWQSVGFMHGVLNTDNMSILGLTLDYGPFGFMAGFDPAHICNHSDNQGRYSYQMQPQIGHWNCAALAQTFVPLVEDIEAIKDALDDYPALFAQAQLQQLRAKLGLQTGLPADRNLVQALYDLLTLGQFDHTSFWRSLSRFPGSGGSAQIADLQALAQTRNAESDAACAAWLAQYQARLQQENLTDEARWRQQLACNPKFVLHNHLAQAAIDAAQKNDFSEIQKLLTILQTPFDEQPEHAAYAGPPPAWACELCVSCSS